MLSINIIKEPMTSNQINKQVLKSSFRGLLSPSPMQKYGATKDGDIFFNSNKIKLLPGLDNFLRDFFNPNDYASF